MLQSFATSGAQAPPSGHMQVSGVTWPSGKSGRGLQGIQQSALGYQGGLPEEVGFEMQEEFESRGAGRDHGNRTRPGGS